MPNPFQLKRAHGAYPERFLHIATGDGILAVDVQAALEAIALADGASLEDAERAGAEARMEDLKKPRAARELYARLRVSDGWERCPHGYATVLPLSAAKAQRAGRFLIRAPWQPPEADALDILIEPGLAFGLGTHATTRLPLLQLPGALAPGQTAADVGCGSGVLAIAMARLGAARVEAVDRDAAAVAEARDNFVRNAVESVAGPPRVGSAGDLCGPFDVITANMGGAPSVIEIAPDVAARLHPGGAFLASGIYGDNDAAATETADAVARALTPLGLVEERRDMEHQCVGIVFRRMP
jgi:ribosomal protein L11 methylase PrmA